MFISKKALALGTLLTMSASMNVFAQSTSICDNPIQRVCKETQAQRAQRDIYVNKLKKEISDEATSKSTPRIEEMKKKVSKFRFIKRLIESFKIRNQEIMRAAKSRVAGIESVVTNEKNISLLKNNMKQAIDESNIDGASKDNFKEIINSIVVGNFADFIEKTGLEDNVLAQLLSNACGSDGLVDNAFATTLNNQRYVLVCPGFLITLSQESSERARMNTIMHAMSHEMGHHIDNSKVGNEVYAPFLQCISKNYVTRFNKTKDDEKFCKDNAKEPAKCDMKVTLSHAGELVADQWGIKATNIYARNEGMNRDEVNTLLTESWAKLCGTGDEGIHPTGDFRIGTLLRINPEVSDILSCGSNPTTTPACTLDGEVQF